MRWNTRATQICAKKTHLFGLAAGRSQQERVQDVLPSQEEAVAVLVQEDGGERQLAVVAAEDGRAVGGQQVCGGKGGEERVSSGPQRKLFWEGRRGGG